MFLTVIPPVFRAATGGERLDAAVYFHAPASGEKETNFPFVKAKRIEYNRNRTAFGAARNCFFMENHA